MMVGSTLKRKSLITETKLRGCTFSSQTIDALERYLLQENLQGKYKEFLGIVCEKLKDAEISGTVEPAHLQLAIASVTSVESKVKIFVISAFKVPKLRYIASQNAFESCPLNASRLSSSKDKIDAYRDRFNILLQRSLRYELFSKSVFEGRNGRSKLQIRTIASLEGVASDLIVTIMGMIYVREDGTYFMEDLTSKVPVDLTRAKYTSGFFVNGCFVIAQGTYTSGIFHISGLGFPPAESRAQSLNSLLNKNDFFGFSEQSGTIEEERNDPTLMITLCDVFLNQPKVLTKLREFMATLAGLVADPSAVLFVFVGSFSDSPFNYGDFSSSAGGTGGERQRYTQGFDRLADLLAGEFSEFAAKSKFVFIPGPNDPTIGGFVLPQSTLPSVFTSQLRRKLAHATFSSNPCRIRFYTQEVVIFRDDSVAKHRRHCLPALPPLPIEKPNIHLVKTILDQAHLSSVPLAVTPVLWAFDHALHLFPLPDLLVLCDPTENWETLYMDCQVLNPGNFSTSGTFVFYHAGTRHHEFQKMSGSGSGSGSSGGGGA